jgi:thiamine-phosphate pyrophosphorylase
MHILAITPGEGLDRARWERVAGSGIDAFMIREPGMDPRELLVAVRWLRDLAPGLGLWINGRLDVALAGRCGLHAPEAYPQVPHGLLTLSRPIHDPDQVPERSGAHQLILSPIFPVPGKGPAWGPGKLRAVLDAMPPVAGRVLALGGISTANAAQLKHARLDGVALIRALWSAPDPALAVAQLRASWRTDGAASS